MITITTYNCKNGILDKKIIFINGQIISSKKNNKSEIVKFEQLNINLKILNTTIKKPKLQETSTLNFLVVY